MHHHYVQGPMNTLNLFLTMLVNQTELSSAKGVWIKYPDESCVLSFLLNYDIWVYSCRFSRKGCACARARRGWVCVWGGRLRFILISDWKIWFFYSSPFGWIAYFLCWDLHILCLLFCLLSTGLNMLTNITVTWEDHWSGRHRRWLVLSYSPH